MIRKILYSLTGFVGLALIVLWSPSPITISTPQTPAPLKTVLVPAPEFRAVSVIESIPPLLTTTTVKAAAPVKTGNHHLKLRNLALKEVGFDHLPGWDSTDMKKSLLAFQTSCKTFVKQKPSQTAGPQALKLQARDWQPACREALSMDSVSEAYAREFFENRFHVMEFNQKRPINGVFTGYYTPQLKGSLSKTAEFSTPIYGPPRDGNRHYTRADIDRGAIKGKAPVIAWIHSPVDRLFMEIEGAGVIRLANNKKLYLGYAGQNGARYTSIASVLIKQGVMTRHTASKTAIKRYLEDNPKRAEAILHQNQSFVYFEAVNEPVALGAQGMALTPGYSLAVDKKWIPLGAPLWLATQKPDKQQFQRLMIAQDTGGAIQGAMRGDVYWGSTRHAAYLGEHMKNIGRFWLLLPKMAFKRLEL